MIQAFGLDGQELFSSLRVKATLCPVSLMAFGMGVSGLTLATVGVSPLVPLSVKEAPRAFGTVSLALWLP